MDQHFCSRNQSPIDMEEQIRLILKQHVSYVDNLVDVILSYTKCAPNSNKSVDSNKEHQILMTDGKDTICGNDIVSNNDQPLDSSRDTSDTQSIELLSTGTTVSVSLADGGLILLGEVLEISTNSVLVLLDDVSAEHMGSQCIIQHRNQMVIDTANRSRKCTRLKSRSVNIPERSPPVRTQNVEEILLISGFIRSGNLDLLGRMGSDVCRLMVAFYHRDRLNKCIEKISNIFEIILLYFKHPVFDVIQCQSDFYLKVDSGDKEIDKWFNTKLEQYRVPFAPVKETGERSIVTIIQLNGQKVRFKNWSTESSESELADVEEMIMGLPCEQISFVYGGRLLSPGARLSHLTVFHSAIRLRGKYYLAID